MKLQHLLRNSVLVAVFVAFALAAASPAHASTIWTDWNPGASTSTTATGTMGGVAVTYTGQYHGFWSGLGLGSTPLWAPASSYTGGVVGNAPPQAYDAVVYGAGSSGTETITFSSPVTNPVISIWSLGEPTVPAVFIFDDSVILEAGGPDGYYEGQSIEVCTGTTTDASGATIGTGCGSALGTTGTVVYGLEGSGTIELIGTYSSITFTTPDNENYYGFTVGVESPEPETLSLLGLGLLALPLLRASLARRRRA